MTTEEVQLQETHSPLTVPSALRGLCCVQTSTRWRRRCSLTTRPRNLPSVVLCSFESSHKLASSLYANRSPRGHRTGKHPLLWSSVLGLEQSHMWSSRSNLRVWLWARRQTLLQISEPGRSQTCKPTQCLSGAHVCPIACNNLHRVPPSRRGSRRERLKWLFTCSVSDEAPHGSIRVGSGLWFSSGGSHSVLLTSTQSNPYHDII